MSHFDVSEAFLRVTTDWTNAQKNLDPEQLKEVQESQARMVKMQSSITSGDLGRWVPLVPISAPSLWKILILELQTVSRLCLRRVPVKGVHRPLQCQRPSRVEERRGGRHVLDEPYGS